MLPSQNNVSVLLNVSHNCITMCNLNIKTDIKVSLNIGMLCKNTCYSNVWMHEVSEFRKCH